MHMSIWLPSSYVPLFVCTQVSVSSLQSRESHSAAAFGLGPGLTEVTVFGGCPEYSSDRTQMANTTVLRFGESTSCCVCPTLAIWSNPMDLGNLCTKERALKVAVTH